MERMNSNLLCLTATYATELSELTYWLGHRLTIISNAIFYISNQPGVYGGWQMHKYMSYLYLSSTLKSVLQNLLQLEWMLARSRKMTVGAAYNVFALGEGTTDLESREKLWFGHKHYKVQRSVKVNAFEWIAVEVVWVDLAGAWFYGKRRHGVTSQSHPKTHHILHFVGTVTCSGLFYIMIYFQLWRVLWIFQSLVNLPSCWVDSVWFSWHHMAKLCHTVFNPHIWVRLWLSW